MDALLLGLFDIFNIAEAAAPAPPPKSVCISKLIEVLANEPLRVVGGGPVNAVIESLLARNDGLLPYIFERLL